MNRYVFRIASGFAVVLYIALLGWILVFFLKNLLLVGGLIAVAVLFILAAWLLFSGTGRRRLEGFGLLAIGAVLFVFDLVYVHQRVEKVWLGVALLVMLAYLVLAALLRQAYWSNRRRAARSTLRIGSSFRHPFLILNPKAGNGRALKARIPERAAEQGITVIETTRALDVEAAAKRAVDLGADVLGISGGDGSIGAVAKVAMEHQLPIVILPGGTRCHFARDIGLDPRRIVDSLSGYQGVERRIDVGTINGRIFLNNVSFGLYADATQHPEYREHKRQVFQTVVREIVDGSKRPYELEFTHANHHFTHAIQVLVSVNPYQMFSLLEPARRSSMDSGKLQVTVIAELNDEYFRRLIRGISSKQLREYHDKYGLYQWEQSDFRITGSHGSLVVGVDGETEAYSTPVTVGVIPRALRVFVPAEGVRSRPDRLLSFAMLRHLYEEAFTGKV